MKKRGGIARFREAVARFRGTIVRFRVDIARLRPISLKSEDMMKREHPAPAMTLPISIEIYQQLLSAAAKTGFTQEFWGYQWKQVFLPNGTLLRTVYNGKNYHCLVEGDHILYDGKKVSPSRFVNAVGGVRRNAWKVVWILFPNTTGWRLAEALRKRNSGRSSQR